MIAQLIAFMMSTGLGIIISIWENHADRKAKLADNNAERDFKDKVSERKQIEEFRKLENEVNVTPITHKKKFMFTLWGKQFGYESELDASEPIASPAQHYNNTYAGMLIFTYCAVILLYAYNAKAVIYSFAPTEATDHWSVLFGLASSTIAHPQILEVSCGGIAVWLLNPIITVFVRRLTGAVFSGRKG